jgi:hypothetical protein
MAKSTVDENNTINGSPSEDIKVMEDSLEYHSDADSLAASEDLLLAATAKKIDSEWLSYYNDLVDIKNEFGDCNVPTDDPDDQLGVWVGCQRQSYMLGELFREEIDMMLNSIGFVWTAELGEMNEQKKKKLPTVNVPQKHGRSYHSHLLKY